MAVRNPTPCSVSTCGRPVVGFGFCTLHWQRHRNTNGPRCSVQGCAKVVHCFGICTKHRDRLLRTGTTANARDLSTEERFWSKVDRRGADECWPWLSGRLKAGYGSFRLGETKVGAHAYAWRTTYHGPIHPDRAIFRHSCDTPPCCNPAHVYPGTQAENRADCVAKGRHARGDSSGARVRPERRPRGERHTSAKLTDSLIVSIRTALAGGEFQTRIARRLGVTQATISAIKRRRIWKHVH